MKRGLLLLFVLLCFGISEANLVLNGDFQDPDFTGADSLGNLTDWKTLRGDDKAHRDDKGTAAWLPGVADNQAPRLRATWSTGTIRQFLAHNWTATDVYTLSLNAAEVSWQSGENTQNSIEIRLLDKDDGWANLWSTSIDLDGTHDGSNPHGDWTATQTFSFNIDASTFTTGTEGGQLILEIKATENIASVDNVSMVPEPATLILLGLGSLVTLRKRR